MSPKNCETKSPTVLEKLISEINASAAKWMMDPAAAAENVRFLVEALMIGADEGLLMDFTDQLAEVGKMLKAMDGKPACDAYLNLAAYMLALSKVKPQKFCTTSLRKFFIGVAERFPLHPLSVEFLMAASLCIKVYDYIDQYAAGPSDNLPKLVKLLAYALADRDSLAIVHALMEISSPDHGFVPRTAAATLYEWGQVYARENGADGEGLRLDMSQVVWRIAVNVAHLEGKKSLPQVAIDAVRDCLAAGRETSETVSLYCLELPQFFQDALLADKP